MQDPTRQTHVKKRLQRRFALISGGLLVVTSLIFLVLVTSLFRDRILKAHERASLSVNLLLQAALENAMVKRDLDGLQDIIARLGAQEGIDGVLIVNPQGEVRFSSHPEQILKPFEDPGFARALSSRQAEAAFRTLANGGEVLRSINPVHNKPVCRECHGDVAQNPVNGLLVVDYVSSDVRREARNGAIVLGLLGVAVLIAIEVGLWFALHRFVLARLGNLRRATRQLAGGDLSTRAQEGGQDEIDALGHDFNVMAGQLERSVSDLKASQGFLQALIDAVPDGVRVIDGDFNTVMVNDAFCKQLGITRDAAVGRPCHAVSHQRAARCVQTLVRCPVAEIIHEGGARLKCDHIHKAQDGADVPVEVYAAPVTLLVDGKEVPCVVESLRDLQAQFNISQEQRLSEMGMIAAGVAHEVNNPLSSIGLALRAIGREPGQSERVRKYLEIARSEIETCKRFSESLLRLAAAPQKNAELVDMGRVLSDTVSLLGFEAQQSGVTLVCDSRERVQVRASDSDMRTLVFNLLLNAIHAMPDGGEAQAQVSAQGDLVVVQIRDTGVGISDRDRDKILLPFWTKRADGSRGRGLGLSICSSIVDRLGGRMTFESELGRGTTFRVELPSGQKVRT